MQTHRAAGSTAGQVKCRSGACWTPGQRCVNVSLCSSSYTAPSPCRWSAVPRQRAAHNRVCAAPSGSASEHPSSEQQATSSQEGERGAGQLGRVCALQTPSFVPITSLATASVLVSSACDNLMPLPGHIKLMQTYPCVIPSSIPRLCNPV